MGTPTLNRIAQSWSDIKAGIQITGGQALDTEDFADVSWKSEVAIGMQRGTGGAVKKSTRGSLTESGTMELYAASFRAFLLALSELATEKNGLKEVSTVFFDLIIQHTPPGETAIFHTELLGCRLLSFDKKNAEGDDSDKVACTLFIGQIVEVVEGSRIVLLAN